MNVDVPSLISHHANPGIGVNQRGLGAGIGDKENRVHVCEDILRSILIECTHITCNVKYTHLAQGEKGLYSEDVSSFYSIEGMSDCD